MQAIIGGKDVERIEDHNYMVLILSGKRDGAPSRSAGTIISKSKIVTTAHSLFGKEKVSLGLGTSGKGSGPPHRILDISEDEIIIHPDYRKGHFHDNDIAVIKLKEKLDFDLKIGNISMVDNN